MKKLLLSFILCLFSILLHAQDREAVIKVLHTQREAWNRGDINGYMQGYWKSDSLVFVGKAAPVYGCGFLQDDSAWVPILNSLPADEKQEWIENFDPSRYLPRCVG